MRPSASNPVPADPSSGHAAVEPTAAQADGLGLETFVVAADGYAILGVRGEIDPATSTQFGKGIDAAFALAAKVVIDLSEVTFMDSTGIRVLIQAYQHAEEEPGALVLRNPRGSTAKVLEITGLDQIFTIEVNHPDEEDPEGRGGPVDNEDGVGPPPTAVHGGSTST